ncbi:helix-turn-helix domain-containing protein [Paenibacillus sp. 8b26]|uniref:helix-turn-helix domain-containing protein n=1 Tax=Paenibacillus sp. 8b26 TaxID=3424133 RepID=UPI003D6474F1
MNMLKKLRMEKEWSQQELANRSGVSQSHIHYLESGTKQPTLTILNKLASALDVPVVEFLSEGSNSVAKEVG